jgi:hypothetical protein
VPNPTHAASGRLVFTDIAGRAFIRLPLVAAASALALLLIISLLLAWRDKALGTPLALAAGMTVGGVAASVLGGFILSLLRPGDFWRAYPLIAYLAIYAVLLLVMTAIYARFGRRIDLERLRAASWLLILLLGAMASFALPGATIFFLVAPAVALLGIGASRRSPRLADALAIGAVLIQFLMFAQLLAEIEMLLIDGPLWAVAPLAALACLPALIEVRADALRPSIVVLAFGSVSLSATALAMPRASQERPLGFSIDYFRDVAGKTADWAIATKQAPLPKYFPGSWSAGELPYNGRKRWIMRAPLLQTPVASARVVASKPIGVGRRLRILLSPGGGNTISMRFPKDAKVLALGLPNAAISLPSRGEPEKPLLRCTGRSCDGLQIEVLFGDRKPVEAELFSTRFGLPPQGRPLIAARPNNAIPQYAPDQTITRSIVRL